MTFTAKTQPPNFCRIIKNFVLFHHDQLEELKNTMFNITLIGWVSNASVGSPAFYFAVCITNHVAALSFKKQRAVSLMLHFTVNSRHLGLTSSEGLSGLSYELFYSARRSSKFYFSILLSVLQVNMPPKRSIESF